MAKSSEKPSLAETAKTILASKTAMQGADTQPDATPDVDQLKTRLDALVAEREVLIAERARLQDDLVKVWGKANVNEAVSTIAANENKITSLGTVIEHAQAEHQRALAESYVGEYAALRDEIARLVEQRQALTADLAAAQQTYELSRYAFDQAEGNFAGALSSATSLLEPATMPNAEITERYGRAIEMHHAVRAAADARREAHGALHEAEADYLDLYHEIALKQRRAHELGALTNAPYDPAVAYRAG